MQICSNIKNKEHYITFNPFIMSTPLLTQWYAVYTKPRWEKKVAELLSKKGVINYCPLNKVKKQWHDRKKLVLEPLFTSYVFVNTTPQQYAHIKSTPGVINFVHWLGKPAVVREVEINAIRSFLMEYSAVQIKRIQVSLNDEVKVITGPLMHQEGKVVQISNNTVKIELPSMGYALIATVSKEHIEHSSKEQPNQQIFFGSSKTERFTMHG